VEGAGVGVVYFNGFVAGFLFAVMLGMIVANSRGE